MSRELDGVLGPSENTPYEPGKTGMLLDLADELLADYFGGGLDLIMKDFQRKWKKLRKREQSRGRRESMLEARGGKTREWYIEKRDRLKGELVWDCADHLTSIIQANSPEDRDPQALLDAVVMIWGSTDSYHTPDVPQFLEPMLQAL